MSDKVEKLYKSFDKALDKALVKYGTAEFCSRPLMDYIQDMCKKNQVSVDEFYDALFEHL